MPYIIYECGWQGCDDENCSHCKKEGYFNEEDRKGEKEILTEMANMYKTVLMKKKRMMNDKLMPTI